jgi:hypothetical protein
MTKNGIAHNRAMATTSLAMLAETCSRLCIQMKE